MVVTYITSIHIDVCLMNMFNVCLIYAWAAVTEYYRLDGLNNRNLFSQSFGCWEIQDQVAGKFGFW